MVSLLSAWKRLAWRGGGGLTATLVLAAQTFVPQGNEYSLTQAFPGDQVHPQLDCGRDGGYVVWQDNAVDGNGLGIGAMALDAYLSPVVTKTFRVNQQTAGDQENPAVQLLPGGGALFAWQGGPPGSQDIWARVMRREGTWATGDLPVNSHTAGQQGDPALAALPDGNIVVVWVSQGQDESLLGVYAQVLAPSGAKVGGEFQVNQFAAFNQRSPAVASLENGDFVVAWVSEQQRFENSVDIYARRYTGAGTPQSNEFRVNATTNVCANPALVGVQGGGFLVAWSQMALGALSDSWDVYAAAFGASGARVGEETRLNQYQLDRQFGPRLARVAGTTLAVWTSLRQDGSREGVYGRFLTSQGALSGDEFRVNTRTLSQQMHPAVAGDGERRLMVAWSSFLGGDTSFEIVGQRYGADQVLVKPSPPAVSALDSYSLLVSWESLAGYVDLRAYRVYADSAPEPLVVTNNFLVLSDLTPGSTHTYRLAYELKDGMISPLSDAASGATWGRDRNFDGLPDDWQTSFWGADSRSWPAATADSDQDGAANRDEFLAGTNPTDARSLLRLSIRPTIGGLLVEWNALAGSVYQLQASGDLNQWANLGSPRFAAGSVGSTVIPASSTAAYYRVVRVR